MDLTQISTMAEYKTDLYPHWDYAQNKPFSKSFRVRLTHRPPHAARIMTLRTYSPRRTRFERRPNRCNRLDSFRVIRSAL